MLWNEGQERNRCGSQDNRVYFGKNMNGRARKRIEIGRSKGCAKFELLQKATVFCFECVQGSLSFNK